MPETESSLKQYDCDDDDKSPCHYIYAFVVLPHYCKRYFQHLFEQYWQIMKRTGVVLLQILDLFLNYLSISMHLLLSLCNTNYGAEITLHKGIVCQHLMEEEQEEKLH